MSESAAVRHWEDGPSTYDVRCERCASTPIGPTEHVSSWIWGERPTWSPWPPPEPGAPLPTSVWWHRCPALPPGAQPLQFEG
jgi:hypothetical protein